MIKHTNYAFPQSKYFYPASCHFILPVLIYIRSQMLLFLKWQTMFRTHTKVIRFNLYIFRYEAGRQKCWTIWQQAFRNLACFWFPVNTILICHRRALILELSHFQSNHPIGSLFNNNLCLQSMNSCYTMLLWTDLISLKSPSALSALNVSLPRKMPTHGPFTLLPRATSLSWHPTAMHELFQPNTCLNDQHVVT